MYKLQSQFDSLEEKLYGLEYLPEDIKKEVHKYKEIEW